MSRGTVCSQPRHWGSLVPNPIPVRRDFSHDDLTRQASGMLDYDDHLSVSVGVTDLAAQHETIWTSLPKAVKKHIAIEHSRIVYVRVLDLVI